MVLVEDLRWESCLLAFPTSLSREDTGRVKLECSPGSLVLGVWDCVGAAAGGTVGCSGVDLAPSDSAAGRGWGGAMGPVLPNLPAFGRSKELWAGALASLAGRGDT